MKEIKISIREFNWLMLFATRYAVGRMSTAPSIMADLIKENKEHLKKETIENIINEIETAKRAGCLGMDCDINTWEEVIEEFKK